MMVLNETHAKRWWHQVFCHLTKETCMVFLTPKNIFTSVTCVNGSLKLQRVWRDIEGRSMKNKCYNAKNVSSKLQREAEYCIIKNHITVRIFFANTVTLNHLLNRFLMCIALGFMKATHAKNVKESLQTVQVCYIMSFAMAV